MYTLKDIAEKLTLTFHIGDEDSLIKLMFDGDQFADFRGKRKGKPQFLQCVQEIYPEVDSNRLHEDYHINRSLISSNMNYIRNYHRRSQLYPNYEFIYAAPNMGDMNDVAILYKTLDKVVLPIDSFFWNFFSPPNYFGDGCRINISDKAVTNIPDNLPLVDDRFIVNRHDLFFDKEPFCQKSILESPISKKDSSISTTGININKLVEEALIEVYGLQTKELFKHEK